MYQRQSLNLIKKSNLCPLILFNKFNFEIPGHHWFLKSFVLYLYEYHVESLNRSIFKVSNTERIFDFQK